MNYRLTSDDVKKRAEEIKTNEPKVKIDYYKDLTGPLTRDELRAINDEVGKYSAANKWSIPAADMRNFVSDWKEALKEKDVKTKAKKLYRIYSTLEDSNWHDENRHLLDGDFDYFNDTYFSP